MKCAMVVLGTPLLAHAWQVGTDTGRAVMMKACKVAGATDLMSRLADA